MFERYNETEELVKLPFSGNKYHVSIDGKIFNDFSHAVKKSIQMGYSLNIRRMRSPLKL